MDIFDNITQIIFNINSSKGISLSDELQKDLGLDSIQMVMLLIMIEETFKITLDESDMNPFDLVTVSHIVSLVKKYMGGDTNEKKD